MGAPLASRSSAYDGNGKQKYRRVEVNTNSLYYYKIVSFFVQSLRFQYLLRKFPVGPRLVLGLSILRFKSLDCFRLYFFLQNECREREPLDARSAAATILYNGILFAIVLKWNLHIITNPFIYWFVSLSNYKTLWGFDNIYWIIWCTYNKTQWYIFCLIWKLYRVCIHSFFQSWFKRVCFLSEI